MQERNILEHYHLVRIEFQDDADPSQQIIASSTQSFQSLIEKLKIGPLETIEPLSSNILQKYIYFAKQCVHPKLSKEAADLIKLYYLQMRDQYNNNRSDSTPVTTRQLESLIRLSEARAKLALESVVTPDHVRDVIELVNSCQHDVKANEKVGKRSGYSTGKRAEAKRFIAELKRVSGNLNQTEFSHQELYSVGQNMRLQTESFQDFIDTLNHQGFLLLRPNRMYKLGISD
jgi:DNA helicase MCM8